MSEQSPYCDRIADWLLEPDKQEMPAEVSGHAQECSSCRDQLWMHQRMIAAFAETEVPELSPGFDADLERKLAVARVSLKPLSGWRMAAMLAYGIVAAGILFWALGDVPLPKIDFSAPWVPVAALAAVPLTLSLAVAASRWAPTPAPKAPRQAWAL